MEHPLLTWRLLAISSTSNILNFHSDRSEMLQKTFTSHFIKYWCFIASNLFPMTHSAATHRLTLLSTPSILSHLVWTNMADKYGKLIPARFDTAIIKRKMEGIGGIKGKIFYIKLLQRAKLMLFLDYCVGQVHCIFHYHL